MSTVAIVLIIAGVAILLALLLTVGRRAQEKRRDTKRLEAQENRREASVRGARADRASAEAEERAARAKREQAEARESAAVADRERRAATERHEYAEKVDPDR